MAPARSPAGTMARARRGEERGEPYNQGKLGGQSVGMCPRRCLRLLHHRPARGADPSCVGFIRLASRFVCLRASSEVENDG